MASDPDEDIDNPQKRGNYVEHNFAPVRITVFWTRSVFLRKANLAQSLQMINSADAILRKYRLSLNVEPVGAASPAAHAQSHKKIHDDLKAERKQPWGLSQVLSRPPAAVPFIEASRNEKADRQLDKDDMVQKGLIPFDESIFIPDVGLPPIEQFRPLRQLIDPTIKNENRLIVVFVPLAGGPTNGFTALYQDWLPWVLVDPRDFSDTMALMHEIGHACRLAHQQVDGVARADTQQKLRNMMSFMQKRNQFWDWQVDAIYRSYWCEGSRPQNWWYPRSVRQMAVDYPYLWEP